LASWGWPKGENAHAALSLMVWPTVKYTPDVQNGGLGWELYLGFSRRPLALMLAFLLYPLIVWMVSVQQEDDAAQKRSRRSLIRASVFSGIVWLLLEMCSELAFASRIMSELTSHRSFMGVLASEIAAQTPSWWTKVFNPPKRSFVESGECYLVALCWLIVWWYVACQHVFRAQRPKRIWMGAGVPRVLLCMGELPSTAVLLAGSGLTGLANKIRLSWLTRFCSFVYSPNIDLD
jgi:hypothetical protein